MGLGHFEVFRIQRCVLLAGGLVACSERERERMRKPEDMLQLGVSLVTRPFVRESAW